MHKHGVRYGDKWVTSHLFDLVSRLKRDGRSDLVGTLDPGRTQVGEKFIFKLQRPMPDPIPKLQRP